MNVAEIPNKEEVAAAMLRAIPRTIMTATVVQL